MLQIIMIIIHLIYFLMDRLFKFIESNDIDGTKLKVFVTVHVFWFRCCVIWYLLFFKNDINDSEKNDVWYIPKKYDTIKEEIFNQKHQIISLLQFVNEQQKSIQFLDTEFARNTKAKYLLGDILGKETNISEDSLLEWRTFQRDSYPFIHWIWMF